MKSRLSLFFVATALFGLVIAVGAPHIVSAENDPIQAHTPKEVTDGQLKASLNDVLYRCTERTIFQVDATNPNGALQHDGNPTAEEISTGAWFTTGNRLGKSTPNNGDTADVLVRKYLIGWTSWETTTFYCDNLNSYSSKYGTPTDLINIAASKEYFNWGGMVQGACKIGLVRSNGKDCVNDQDQSDFKRSGYISQAKDVSPAFNSPAASYIRKYLSYCTEESFIRVDTANADAKATNKYTVPIVIVEDKKTPKVVQAYITSSTYLSSFCLGITESEANAYRDWLRTDGKKYLDDESATPAITAPADAAPVCTGGSLGWVLCPVATLMQDLIKWVAYVIGSLMETQPIAGKPSLQNVWSVFVGFANLLLVIAFLVVIFSQATSVGLNAYGIKKMLPKIIAGAIMINLSYFLCSLLLDATNIVGGSIKDIVNAVPVVVNGTTTSSSSWGADITSLALTGVGVYMLATGYVSFIVPALIVGALAVVSILLIIALRQVIVILLVLVSPLAFAAMILPNTEPLFTKWRKLFVNMLVMYPVVMFLLYGSELAGKLIQITATEDNASAMLTKMVAFLAMTIGPFAGLYMYLKNSNKLMTMAAGGINKLGSGLKKWGDDWAGRTKDNNYTQQRRKGIIEASSTAKRHRNLYKMDAKGAPRYMKPDAQQILNTQTNEAVEKIHGQRVTFAKQAVSKRFNASDEGDRTKMAAEAISAIKSGDRVELDALMSHAATIGPDEFKSVYDKVQKGIDPKGQEGKLLGESNRFIYATHGAELGQKSRGLMSMLQTGDPTKNIEDVMYNDDGIRTYYRKMSADKASVFSSETAKAAAQFINDDVLEKLIFDPNTSKNVGTSAMAAYRDEYAARNGIGGDGSKVPQGTTATYKKDGDTLVLDEKGDKIVISPGSVARNPDSIKGRGEAIKPRDSEASRVTTQNGGQSFEQSDSGLFVPRDKS